MKLPESVKVGHFVYNIEDWCHRSANANGAYGMCSKQEGVIRIDTKALPQMVRDTLLHEIMHACYREWGIASEDDEERTVGQMATAMTTVMIDNPELRKWFAEAWGG
jgi:hypothetical protein